MTVEEQDVRGMLERFTPYPPTSVSVADIEQRLLVPREARLVPSRGWTPLLAAAAVVAVIAAVALIARFGSTTTQRPARPVPSPTVSIGLGQWHATMVLPGQFDQVVSTGSSLIALDENGLLSEVPGQGVQARAALPHDSGSSMASFGSGAIAFDGSHVWIALAGSGDDVVLRRYSFPALTLQRAVTLHPGHPIADPFLAIGAPGEILVGSARKVLTVSTADLSTLGSLTLGGDVNGLAWHAADSHLYAAVEGPANSGVEDYVRTGPASYALRETAPGAGSPLPEGLALSDHGVWEIGGLNHYYLKFASFDNLRHPAQVVPSNLGDATVTVDRRTAWIGGTILGCANPNTGKLRAPIEPLVGPAGATIQLLNIVSLHGVLYAGYTQYNRNTVRQSGIVKLDPPAACTG